MYVILVQDVDSGGSYVCVVQRVYGNSLYFLLNFAVNLKVLYKMKLIKNILKHTLILQNWWGSKFYLTCEKLTMIEVKWRVQSHTAS